MNEHDLQVMAEYVLLALPVIVGLIIAAINSAGVNRFIEGIENFFRKSLDKNRRKQSRIIRFTIIPLLWLMVKLSDWTDGMSNRGVKSGVRMTLFGYVLVFWVIAMFYAMAIVVSILIMGFFLMIIYKYMQQADPQGASNVSKIVDSAKQGWEYGKQHKLQQLQQLQHEEELTDQEYALQEHYENIRLQQEELARQREELLQMQYEAKQAQQYTSEPANEVLDESYIQVSTYTTTIRKRNKQIISW